MSDQFDRAVKNAMSERTKIVDLISEAQRKIADWKIELDRIDVFIGDWHRFAGVDAPMLEQASGSKEAAVHSVQPVPGAASYRRPRPRNNSSKELVAATARDLIAAKGEPIQPAELFDALIAKGLTIEGTDPKGVLTTMLWRMRDLIVRVKGGGYWLTGVPNPEYDYDPAKLSFHAIGDKPLSEIKAPDSPANEDVFT